MTCKHKSLNGFSAYKLGRIWIIVGQLNWVPPVQRLKLMFKSRRMILYLGSRGESGSSNNPKVGGSIPTLTAQRLVNWQLEGWQSTSLPWPRCPWTRHCTPMLPRRCEWLPTAPVYGICLHDCVTLCKCVFNRCQTGWVKCGGVILCISCIYMTIKGFILILTACHPPLSLDCLCIGLRLNASLVSLCRT